MLFLAACISCVLAADKPVLRGTLPIKNVAVLLVADKLEPSQKPALLATTFAAVGSEPVYYIEDIASLNGSNVPTVSTLEDEVKWTNYVGMVPKDAVPGSTGGNFVLTAGGFLVPGHTTGSIDLWGLGNDPSKATRTKLSADKKDWFYHKAIWHDINGDGRQDILAARATAPTNGDAKGGELLWLEQPANGTGTWLEHVLVSGPDVSFIFEDLDGDGRFELIATQFFTAPILAIYSCQYPLWAHCGLDDPTPNGGINVTIIDEVNGPFFTVERTDLNGDGKPELVVSNNRDGKKLGVGSVFVYEQPESSSLYDGAAWTMHTVTTGYAPYPKKISGPGRGSPGSVITFHPRTTTTTSTSGSSISSGGGNYPSILVSGDDGGFVSILTPDLSSASDASSWNYTYTQSFLCNSTGTIGSPAVGDIDGDGITELFIPFYSDGKVEVFSFEPNGPTPPAPYPSPVSQQCVACLAKMDPVGLSHDAAWCYADNKCHLVGSPGDPCKSSQCSSQASTSKCGCTTCNDPSCAN
jgi:hypothetical protein